LKRFNAECRGRIEAFQYLCTADYAGRVAPGSSSTDSFERPTLHDVAALAGVSTGTVSNAMNHPDKVAPATLEKVASAIATLGFMRNGAASTLATGTSRTLGLVVIDLMNSLFVDIARGAQQASRAAGFELQLADSDNDQQQQHAHLLFLQSARAAGVLLAPILEPADSVRTLRRNGHAAVLLNYASREVECCTVLIDNEQVGYLAARHLIELGRRRIAFVGGLHPVQPVELRRIGVLRAIAEAGPDVRLLDVETADLNPPSGAVAGAELAAMPVGERPDAVLAVTDLLAMSIISEFVASGIRVPEDVAVMGCDHNSVAWGGAMPLTSVTMRGQDMGRIGVELMLHELHEPPETHRHRTVTLEPALVVRESTVGRHR
jgi:LacI family transcriptional regulator